jgi:hypothetical protein
MDNIWGQLILISSHLDQSMLADAEPQWFILRLDTPTLSRFAVQNFVDELPQGKK